MKEIKILFTGVGRRVELLQSFKQAALTMNINLKLYGADMLGTAPALVYCDCARKVCSMKDPNYIQQLLDICEEDKIDLIIPTIDTDLLILSKTKFLFENIGTRVLISEFDKIMICRDKNNTCDFFELCGLKTPKTCNDYTKYVYDYPCFIKPKDGSSSINAFKVSNLNELKLYSKQIDDYIIQPYIEGTEFTIDVFCDFHGSPIYITPRERVQVRAGEVLTTRIAIDSIMIDECKRIIEKFKPCGPITIQLIKDKNTGDNYYIEINPRFGGGAPLSMKAGANSAEAVLRLLCGESLDFKENVAQNNAIYGRFDQSVCISEGSENISIKGVIFDLDDTLYSEKEYILSGFREVAEYLDIPNCDKELWELFLNGLPAIDTLLEKYGLIEKKDKCLEIYRNHFPVINLYNNVIETISFLKEKGIKIGIITDGRVEGQENKIKALELNKYVDDIIITDSLGGIQFRKPNDISFRIMQNKWKIPNNQIAYVGDNINKDFYAPKQLGMKCIYINNPNGLYYEENRENNIFKLENIEQIRKII